MPERAPYRPPVDLRFLSSVLRPAVSDPARAIALLRLPPRVALLRLRCIREAVRTADPKSLAETLPAACLKILLEAMRGSHRVVELGTATAWTTIALAVDDPAREVTSYDVVERPARTRYLALVERTPVGGRYWARTPLQIEGFLSPGGAPGGA
jgi:hypothetical protein